MNEVVITPFLSVPCCFEEHICTIVHEEFDYVLMVHFPVLFLVLCIYSNTWHVPRLMNKDNENKEYAKESYF